MNKCSHQQKPMVMRRKEQKKTKRKGRKEEGMK
jgi:hypothetical protein